MYAYIIDGTISKYPCSVYDFRKDHPNVSLPLEPSNTQLEEVGLFLVKETNKPSITIGQDVVESAPILVDGVWTQQWSITDSPENVIAQREEALRQQVKSEAMRLLTETDWSQMPDVQLSNKQDFVDYRALVRELAINPPVSVDSWPEKPDELWVTNTPEEI